ncbi:MAG: LysM peptidoglycan-binding domain-containing protein [Bacteroidales bacterium]
MFTKLLIVISLLFVLFPLGMAQTQPVEVVRSEDKVVIENQAYYIHIVKSGQTLYSISRTYNVPQKEILLENPNAYVGLQAGQALKIPVRPEAKEEDLLSEDPDEDFVLHTVEPGQTLFFLSQTYEISMDEIIRHNPGVEEGLQINQVVKIPADKVYIDREGFPTEDDNYIHHKVEKGETLYSLSRRYEIPVKAIRAVNDKLFWGLRYGEYIRIPKDTDEFFDEEEIAEVPADEVPSDEVPSDEVPSDEVPSDEVPAEENLSADIYDREVIIEADCTGFSYREYDRPFNVSLMLPLFIDRNYPSELPDTMDMKEAKELYPDKVWSLDELYQGTVPFLEFYQGALMAVDSLVEAGLSVNFNVYDTQRNPEKVREIMQRSEFRDSDLIIGPVYPHNMRLVADWAHQNRVNIVSPLTSRTDLVTGNPYLFQVTPSTSVELEQASLFISNFPSSNFVLMHKNDPFEQDMVNAFKNNIFRNYSYSSGFDNLVFKEVLFTDVNVNIEQSLVRGKKNAVIIPSTDQAFVSDVLMRLNILSRLYDITIFGLNDWQRFANLDVEYLHNMELHFASPFYVDYEDENVKTFLGKFRNKYMTEPSHYGFQGYDIMFYFLQAMKNYGPDFQECLPIIRTELLQADFLFRKSDSRDGFENNGVTIVKYDKDMNIKRLGLNTRSSRN